ncbi:CinA family protein [Kordiimonas aquimaris]|uniref:CinA family protein n=1 Tax=Kordiimonas aquimaris TaxID=707591 RepID=UPI0021D0E337|nr:CinA family protein [Kordiimonas aquimaris]
MDKETLIQAEKVLRAARLKGMKIATAESCTGGLIAAALTEIAGSSDVVDRGFVTYSNAAKQQMLGVSARSLTEFGAVSEATAKEMAYGALANSRADIAVSVTGIAGPSGATKSKPVGTVWFGLAEQGSAPIVAHMVFENSDRSEVRSKTVKHALSMILNALDV